MSRGSLRRLAAVALFIVTLPGQAGPHFALTPDPGLPGAGLLSPEGCDAEAGLARGLLTASAYGSTCRSGLMGSQAVHNLNPEGPVTDEQTVAASFVTAPLAADLPIGGLARLVVYFSALRDGSSTLTDDIEPTLGVLRLDEISAEGTARVLAYIEAFEVWNWAGVTPATIRAESLLSLPEETARAGTQLRIILGGDLAPDVRLIYGDAPLASISYPNPYRWDSFADAGLTLRQGVGAPGPVAPGPDQGGAAGAPGGYWLLLLAGASLPGRRRRCGGRPASIRLTPMSRDHSPNSGCSSRGNSAR